MFDTRAEALIEAIRTMNQCEGSHHQEVAELYKELRKELEIDSVKNENDPDILKRYSKEELADEIVSRSFASTLCQLGVDGKMEYSVVNGRDGFQDTISGPARVIVSWEDKTPDEIEDPLEAFQAQMNGDVKREKCSDIRRY